MKIPSGLTFILTFSLRCSVSFGFLIFQSQTSRSSHTLLRAAEDINNDLAIISEKLTVGIKKIEKIQEKDFFDGCDGCLKQLNSQITKNVQVSESTIPDAGLGLFATKNIKARAKNIPFGKGDPLERNI